MHLTSTTICAWAALGASACSFGTTAVANDLGASRSVALHAGQRCAEYGPDFTPVEGSDTCVRIGGRVRVDVGRGGTAPLNSGWATGSAAPASMRSGENGYAPPAGPRRLHLGTFDDPFGN